MSKPTDLNLGQHYVTHPISTRSSSVRCAVCGVTDHFDRELRTHHWSRKHVIGVYVDDVEHEYRDLGDIRLNGYGVWNKDTNFEFGLSGFAHMECYNKVRDGLARRIRRWVKKRSAALVEFEQQNPKPKLAKP